MNCSGQGDCGRDCPGRPHVVARRQDQRDTFVCLADGATAIWAYSPTSFLYHATVNGLQPVCGSQTVLETEEPGLLTYDRSDDTMTCRRCMDQVRRVVANSTEARARALDKAEKRARDTTYDSDDACSSGKVAR